MSYHHYICYIAQNGEYLMNSDIPDEKFIENLDLGNQTKNLSEFVYFVDISGQDDERIMEYSLKYLKKFPIITALYDPFGEPTYDPIYGHIYFLEFWRYTGYRDFILNDKLIFTPTNKPNKKYLIISRFMYKKFISQNDPENILYCEYYYIIKNICEHKRHEKNKSQKYTNLDANNGKQSSLISSKS